jgi:hypothetical protein
MSTGGFPIPSSTTPGTLPGYVLDTGTVSDPTNPQVMNIGSATPINIPISYGRRAIFGCVVWSGNFNVTADSSGNVADTCDFAVAFGYPGVPQDEISEVQIARLWIEASTTLSSDGTAGQLIFDRTTPGGFALSPNLDFTIYTGTETQMPDETIVKANGADLTPPMRGMIYVVFKKFNMAQYNLRSIPQLRADLVDINAPVDYFVPFAESGVSAVDTLSMDVIPDDGNTVTIDGQIYTLVSGNSDAPNKVKIGTNISGTFNNLIAAINNSGNDGAGTYGVGTIQNVGVSAAPGLAAGTMDITARLSGVAGNSIAVSADLISGSWKTPTLTGATGVSYALPNMKPITVDWSRQRAYFTSLDGGGFVTLRVYDITGLKEVVCLTICDENGTPIPEALVNYLWIWEVHEPSGVIFTTYGGTANNVQMITINPNTGRITSRLGTVSLAFPTVRNPDLISFPTRIRFGMSTWNGTSLMMGSASGTGYFAFVTTIFNDIFCFAIGPDGTIIPAVTYGNGSTQLRNFWFTTGSFPGNISAFALFDEVYTNNTTPGTTQLFGFQSFTETYGFSAYCGIGNSIYVAYWATIDPNFDALGYFSLNRYGAVTIPVLFDTFSAGSGIQKLVWNKAAREMLCFYTDAALKQHLVRYVIVPTPYGINGIFPVLTKVYDVIVPSITVPAFETGHQDSKWEVGMYGYESGAASCVIVNTQDGSYRTYELSSYVTYSADFATNEAAIPNTFTFDSGGADGSQPFAPAGGYFVCRPSVGGGVVSAGLMYVDGILNVRVPLASLLRWLALSAGYTPDQIYVSPSIDDLIIGCLIDVQTDIFQAIQTLGIIFNFQYFESEQLIKFVRTPTGDALDIKANLTIDNIAPSAGGSTSGGETVTDQEALLVDLQPDSVTPTSISLTFFDFTNDFQASTVVAKRTVFPFSLEKDNLQNSYTIPIIMLPSDAFDKVYKALYVLETQRLTATFRTGFEFLLLEPTDAISLNVNGITYLMALYESTINDDYSLSLGGTALGSDNVTLPSIEDIPPGPGPGPGIAGPQVVETIVIDSAILSIMDDPGTSALAVYLVGYGSNWTSANFYYGVDNSPASIFGSVNRGAAVGFVQSKIIDTGMENFTDENATISIQLVDPTISSAFVSATDDDLLSGLNTALIGNKGSWEVIQYKNVTDLGGGSLLLTGIVRGRRDTEHNMGNHKSGCYFIAVQQPTMPQLQTISESDLGKQAIFFAKNSSQNLISSTQTLNINTTSRKPWSPADYSVVFDTDHFIISWARRTKLDAPLLDGSGIVPLEFPTENFEVDIYDQHTGLVAKTLTVAGAETVNYTETSFLADIFPHKSYIQPLLNPGAELYTTDWTASAGAIYATNGIVNSGLLSFSNAASPALAYQNVAVAAGLDTAIDAGNAKCLLSWYQDGGVTDAAATSAMDVAFYDGSSALISTVIGVQQHIDNGTGTMTHREMIVPIPALTRTIRPIINMPHSGSVYIDDIALTIWVKDLATPTMTLAVYQISDDVLIGRGEGVIKTIDIAY